MKTYRNPQSWTVKTLVSRRFWPWIQCASQEGKAEPVFERAVKQLPFAARIWAAYAEWSEMQAVLFGILLRFLEVIYFYRILSWGDNVVVFWLVLFFCSWWSWHTEPHAFARRAFVGRAKMGEAWVAWTRFWLQTEEYIKPRQQKPLESFSTLGKTLRPTCTQWCESFITSRTQPWRLESTVAVCSKCTLENGGPLKLVQGGALIWWVFHGL